MRLIVATTALLCVSSPAFAQGSDAAERADEDTARDAFETGMQAIDAGLFAEARDALRQSLRAGPRPATAYNLAIALRGTGQVVEGTVVLGTLLQGDYGELSTGGREQAQALLAEIEAEVANLRVRAVGEGRGELSVDGTPVGELDAQITLRVPLDPGEHRLQVAGERLMRWTQSVSLHAGEVEEVVARLEPRPAAVAPAPSRIMRRTVIAVVVVAVVAAGALTAGLLLRGDDTAPQNDPQLGRYEAALASW